MNKTQLSVKVVEGGRGIFSPERKSWFVAGTEYELDAKDFDILRAMYIKYPDNDTAIVSTKAEIEAEVPTFAKATELVAEDNR